MMKKNFARIMVFIFIFCMFTSLIGCGEKKSTNRSQEKVENTKKGDVQKEKKSDWTIELNGKEISLPCTLTDLEGADVHIHSEYDSEAILTTENESFLMIEATCGEGTDPLYLEILTGDDIEQQEENVTITHIANSYMGKELFLLNGSIGLGDSVEDVVDTFGEGYGLTVGEKEELSQGLVVMTYGTMDSGVMLNFRDGILEYIEVLADRGE